MLAGIRAPELAINFIISLSLVALYQTYRTRDEHTKRLMAIRTGLAAGRRVGWFNESSWHIHGRDAWP